MSMRRALLVLFLILLTMAPPAGAAEPSFVVSGFTFTGNTVMSEGELQALASPMRGRDATLHDLQQLAARVTQAYRARGCFLALALVPPQDVKDGVVRIAISEGRIDGVRVEGNQHYASPFILRFFAPVRRERVPRLPTLERCVRLLNDLPSLEARVELRKGRAAESTEVVVKVKESKPQHAWIEADNLGNQLTGLYHAGAGLEATGVASQGDLLVLRGLAVGPSGSQPLVNAAYSALLDDSGTRLTASGGSGAFRVGQGGLQVLNLRGEVVTWGLFLSRPTTRGARRNETWILAVDGGSYNNSSNGIPYSHDEVRTVKVGYLTDWRAPGRRDSVLVAWTQGLGTFLGGTPAGDPLASHFGASNTFGKLDGEAVRLQQLGRCTLMLRASGQWASAPLLVGEQFPLGGIDSVRGYAQNAVLVDSGFSITGELQVPLDPKGNMTGVVFVDEGNGWVRNALPGQPASYALLGAGIGARARLGRDSGLRVDAGVPLGRRAGISSGAPVIYFQLRFGL